MTAAMVTPSAPAIPPVTAPPAIDPAKYHVTVRVQRLPRARSPNGLMLASIDSPHGDHDERIAATIATTTPHVAICAPVMPVRSPALLAIRARVEARIAGLDSRGAELGVRVRLAGAAAGARPVATPGAPLDPGVRER